MTLGLIVAAATAAATTYEAAYPVLFRKHYVHEMTEFLREKFGPMPDNEEIVLDYWRSREPFWLLAAFASWIWLAVELFRSFR